MRQRLIGRRCAQLDAIVRAGPARLRRDCDYNRILVGYVRAVPGP